MIWQARAARTLLAISPLLLLWPPLRQLLEGQMTVHMLLQLPWLMACGAACFHALGHQSPAMRCLARIDDRGLLAVTLPLGVTAFWMMPSALDLALLDTRVAFAKVVTWYAGGLMLASGARRLRPELWAFMLGNLVWMLSTAGLLIRESDTRLCVNYLERDQFWAGTGLVAMALAVAAFALLRVWRPHTEHDLVPI